MALNGAAAARLYDDHVDAVHAMVARRVGAERAPQITGEAFEHALRTWERFDVDRGTERLFVYGSASAVLRRHPAAEIEHLASLRTERVPVATIDDPLMGTVAAPRSNTVESVVPRGVNRQPDDETPARRMLKAIGELAPDDRDILLLALWESLPQSAIAEALDMPVGTIRSALGRIRRELKIAATDTTA